MKKLYQFKNTLALLFISQFQLIIFGILLTMTLPLTNDFVQIIMSYCPIFFFFLVLEYLTLAKQNIFFCPIHLIKFIIFTPIFFGIYFGAYHQIQSYKFEKAENCFVSGKLSSFLLTRDSYTILYVNFDYGGQIYLGYGCSSRQNEGSISFYPFPYKFYFKGEEIQCDSDNRDRTDCYTTDQNGGVVCDSEDDDCDDSYEFSQVKLPIWMCISLHFNFEQFIEKQSCYVHFYNNKDIALENSKNRLSPKYLNNFPIIQFSSQPNYPKAEVICLIVLVYFPMLHSFNCIFYGTSKCIIRFYKKFVSFLQKKIQQRVQIISQQQEYDQKQQQLNALQQLNDKQLFQN